jgi:hypothetical protein
MTANTTPLSNQEFDSLPVDEQDAATAPSKFEAAVATFADGHPREDSSGADSSGEVSPAELARRQAEGLAPSFDDDDDDLDEDLRPTAETAGPKTEGPKTEADKPTDKADAADDEPSETEPSEVETPETDAAKAETAETDSAAADDPARAALVASAKDYGLEVERFPTTASLEACVQAIDRMFHDIGAAELEAAHSLSPDATSASALTSDSNLQPLRPNLQPLRPGESSESALASNSNLQPLRPNLQPLRLKRDEYSPELLDALDEMRTVIDQLRAENQSERSRRLAADEEAAERDIDSFFAEIAADNPVWSETFGEAPAAELLRTTEGQKLFENRMNVLRARDNYTAGLESRRRPTPASRKLLESGLALAFRDKLGEAAERKLARKLQGRHAGSPPRPTQRQTPRREPGSALREAFKRHGMAPDEA